MPSLRPRTSWLPVADLSQWPACIWAVFSGSRRAMAMISASASSTTLRVLENGALNTATPRLLAAVRSIWLVPIQKAPTASRPGAASRTRSVTCVPDRMPSRFASLKASISSSSSRERGRVSTVLPPLPSRADASWWIFSSSNALVVTGIFTFRTVNPDPAGEPGFIPVGRLPLYLTGCGDRPGQLVRVRGAAIRAFVAQVMEPDPDFVGERVRQPVEDGHRLTPGRGGRLAVTFGQQRVT